MAKELLEELDDPSLTLERKDELKNKKFLYKLYKSWYGFLLNRLDTLPKEGKILEIGSGGGFLKELLPEVITSDVMELSNVDMVFSAESMPFEDNSLKCIFMIDVLHHIPNCELFFEEAQRCLVDGGIILMSEPANTPFSRFFYKKFHHEPFDPKAGWKITTKGGPLSNANGAIPWIVFKRDKEIFLKKYPKFSITKRKLHTPFLYFLSGGFSHRALFPAWGFGFAKFIELLFTPFYFLNGMFQLIEVKKKENGE